ncbi:MAG: helix-turn-helix domain-containing protein [Gemmatimonadales bacterium]
MTNDQREIRRMKRDIEYAENIANVRKACRTYGVARSTFYRWRDRTHGLGDEGLMSRRCGPHNHPNKTREGVGKKDFAPAPDCYMGPQRIVWYLERYHQHLDIRRDRLPGLQVSWSQ